MTRRSTNRLLCLGLLTVALAVIACQDTSIAPTAPEFAKGPRVTPLAYCPGTPYDSTTRTIGAGGGTIVAGRGTFTIPAGAVPVPTTITMVQPADSVASYRFYPRGLQFTAALPTLQIDYSNCGKGPTAAPQIVYIDESGHILEKLTSTVLPKHLVWANIRHFSRYAIAW